MARRDAEPTRRAPQGRAASGVRSAAARAVDRTLASQAPAEGFLESALAPFDERDQGLLRELVLGTLRWLRRLDAVLAQASHRPLAEIEPALMSPLRIAAYQLLFLDRVPAHAAVDEAVEQAWGLTHRGGASFVNAVLRRVARAPRLAAWPVREEDPVRRLAIEWSHPDFLVARWLERFGRERTLALLEVNNQPKALQLLAFRDRGGREALAETLLDEGFDVVPTPLAPLGLTVRAGNPLRSAAFARGEFYVQDEASQAAALVPPPHPGERMLDAAAAPGGKSFALLAREPSVRIVAADLAPARAGVLRANLRRLRRELPLVVADAGATAIGGEFDRVVFDLPCSGSGTLRKHPELKWRLSPAEIDRLARRQVELLLAARHAVRRDGLLCAITCSLEAEENEQVVERFLAAAPEFERLPLAGLLAPPLDRYIAGPGLWRLLPGGDHDGFTVGVMRRRG